MKRLSFFGDFNIEAGDKVMKDTFYNIMKQNTWFKGNAGLCIDLLITNSKFSFVKSNSNGAGLNNHHHMLHAILKTKFEKSISNNMIVTSWNWIFLIVCLLWEPMQPLKIFLLNFR